MKYKEYIYKPANYLYYIFIIIFLFVLFLIIMIRDISFTTIALSFFETIIIFSLIELSKSSIIINDSNLSIHGLFKKEIIKFADIGEAKMEDHELYIPLSNGENLDLPFWFANKKSLYMALKNRIKRS